MKQLSLKIHGQVQGVFFRASAQEKAAKLGLVGFVKNASNGNVELVAQGSEEALTKLLKWCYSGPSHAQVEKVEEDWKDVDRATFGEFEIVY